MAHWTSSLGWPLAPTHMDETELPKTPISSQWHLDQCTMVNPMVNPEIQESSRNPEIHSTCVPNLSNTHILPLSMLHTQTLSGLVWSPIISHLVCRSIFFLDWIPFALTHHPVGRVSSQDLLFKVVPHGLHKSIQTHSRTHRALPHLLSTTLPDSCTQQWFQHLEFPAAGQTHHICSCLCTWWSARNEPLHLLAKFPSKYFRTSTSSSSPESHFLTISFFSPLGAQSSYSKVLLSHSLHPEQRSMVSLCLFTSELRGLREAASSIYPIFQEAITVNYSNLASLELSTQPGTQVGLHLYRYIGVTWCDHK